MKEVSNIFNELFVRQANVSRNGSKNVLEGIKVALLENGFRKVEIVFFNCDDDNNFEVHFERNKKSKERLIAKYTQVATRLENLEIQVI